MDQNRFEIYLLNGEGLLMEKVLIEQMSWTEFQEAMKDNDLIIIPVGVTEEHGRHNPLGTDTLIAEACAKLVGERAKAPVAPVMPFGYSPNVVTFPGTNSLDPMLYRKVLISYCESYIKHGAKRFLFINGHGGNTSTLGMVAGDLYDKHNCIAFYTQWWDTLPQINKEWDCDDHGGYFETSMMMAVNEEIIDMEKAQAAPVNSMTQEITYTHGWRYKGASITMPVDLYKMQKIGNVGHEPFAANKELGEKMVETYVDYNVGLANEIRKIEL